MGNVSCGFKFPLEIEQVQVPLKRHRHIFALRLERASKRQTGSSITWALKSLFQDRKTITIQSDKGTEFVNATVQQYLKLLGVNFHTTHNPDIKGAVIERFNKTLKMRIFKYFTKTTHTVTFIS